METSTLKIGKYLWERWDVICILVSMTVVLGFELAGVFEHRYATITGLTKTYIPAWARAMILGWLVFHFLIQQE